MVFLEKVFLRVAYEKIKIEARCGSQNEPQFCSLIRGISKIFRKVCPQKMESPKVENLALKFPVWVRFSEWELCIRTRPKRLPHSMIQFYLEGF